MIGLRHRVFAFPTPGMAASDSLQPEPAPPERPVLFHRLEKILRAGGMKSATGPGPAEPGKERRQSPLVNANETPEEQGHRKGHRIGVCRQRCNRAAPSPFSCSYFCSCSCSFACGTRPKFSNKRTIHRHKRERGKYGNGFRRASGMPVVVGRARLAKRTFVRPSQSLTGPFPLSFWTGLTGFTGSNGPSLPLDQGPLAIRHPRHGGTEGRASARPGAAVPACEESGLTSKQVPPKKCVALPARINATLEN